MTSCPTHPNQTYSRGFRSLAGADGLRRSTWVPPSDELVVAAVARAVRHEATYHGAGDCAYLRDVANHLGFPWHSHTSRRLTPIMERLVERGLVWYERSTHGTGWAVTEDGAELAAKVEGLPESPQHREWRSARG